MTDTVQTTAPTTTEPEGKTRQMTLLTLDDGTIRAEFGPGLDPLILNPAALPESIIAAAIIEGVKSRARGYTSKLEGKDRTPENLRLATAKAFENMLAGIWMTERGTGVGAAEFTIEVEAALLFRQMRAEAKGETCADTLEIVAGQWNSLTDEQQKQIKDLPRYKAAYAQVKAKRQAEKAAKELAKAVAAEAEGDALF